MNMQELLKQVYTPEREAEMEKNRVAYNQALKDGKASDALHYGQKMLKQINDCQREIAMGAIRRGGHE